MLLPLVLLARVILWGDDLPTAVASEPGSSEQAVLRAERPWRDLLELSARLGKIGPDASAPASAPLSGRQEGEKAVFWVADQTSNSYHAVQATLKVVTAHTYMYVADDARVDLAKLREAADGFENRVYQVDRSYFGPEQPTGLDGDPHVSILHASIPGLGGYFTSVDEYPRSVHPYSNERKIIYMNVDAVPPGSAAYYAVLAHEFEHMIQWNANRIDQTWVKEGSAEVATEAAGLGSSGAVRAFQARPDTQLNAWDDSKGDVVPHYGAAYLFISYFLSHFGGYQDAADLLTGSTRGPDTFDSFLSRRGYSATFEDVFKDWIVANYLDESGVENPRYRYQNLKVEVPSTDRVTSSTGWRERTVHQFAADYIELSGRWSTAKIRFRGDTTTRVIAPDAHGGRSFWWSNRGDMVDTKLTHPFDLTGVSGATLKFWAWYDLEDGYDYGYVMVSADGGATWSTLPASDSTSDNPNGNNLGQGFTGKSGGGDEARWVEESVDLNPYAGRQILIRFELVTDDAYNAPGFAVDDISVPELGYSTDAETDDGGWFATGFVRTDGVLPEHFALQLIRFGSDITVEEVPISSAGEAEVVLENGGGRLQRAVLVVAGLTRRTTELAHYRYAVEMTP